MTMRDCPGCGQPFELRRKDQVRCSKHCRRDRHKPRTDSRAVHEIRFIGIDGEGASRPNGDHDYVLLSATGVEPLHRDGARLTTGEIFEWLYFQVFEPNQDAAFVGYFLGYDWSQIFRDLTEHAARMLLTTAGIAARQRTIRPGLPPFPVQWRSWEFDSLGLRRIKLRPRPPKPPPGKKPVEVPWMYICDASAYFQTSFLRAINPAGYLACGQEPPVSAAEYALIAEGKGRRGSETFGPEMIAYNEAELAALPRIVKPLNEAFVRMGVRLKRNQWFGPGQAAQAWLTNINCPSGAEIRETVPADFRDAARRSYYGGWFEIFWHGPYPGTLWEYDINSAYPATMATLPCLLHGRYSAGEGEPPVPGPRDLLLVHAHLCGSDSRLGTMMHRRRDGQIMRPWQTRGWYWLHELKAAEAAGLIDTMEFESWHGYEPCACLPPVAAIEGLYQQRVELGETMKNSAFGVALKLVYNSCYGKFAQSVGNPKFANPVYASLITSGCRVRILDAIASHPLRSRGVAMIATDGVYFTSPHPALELDKTRLGAWSMSERTGMTLFKPGVYWDDKTRVSLASGDARLKSRGIDARLLARHIGELDEQWSALAADRGSWPRLSMPVSFALVSPKQALARGKWHLCGAVIQDARVVQSADPAQKRRTRRPAVGWSAPHMGEFEAGMFILDSSPYQGAMGEESGEDREIGVSPDGGIISTLQQMFKGEF